ncbi:MAG: anthranilate phosphoribosyltransferase [Candidatus Eisenbacteria bacterium]|nr:anthranilate phosphoribosyltransferase [Candidatus Eisenbacteria bacterium]
MIREAINRVCHRENLSREEARLCMAQMMDGTASTSQVASFLTALAMKGETVDELIGCALAMKEKATKISTKRTPVLDTCGTGGDGAQTFNISTAAAFVVAASGVCVAKHGNGAVSSQCGSADAAGALGIKLDAPAAKLEECLEKIGICFLFAPSLHKSMKTASAACKETGIRNIFNLVGPLANPAGAKRQILGVYQADLTEKFALALKELGCTRALVVHGLDGLDEISISAPTKVTELRDGNIHTYEIKPGDFGIPGVRLGEMAGATPVENAEMIVNVLRGAKGAKREIVVLNSAAGLLVAGRVDNLKAGVREAARLIDSGAALSKLDELRRVTSSA